MRWDVLDLFDNPFKDKLIKATNKSYLFVNLHGPPIVELLELMYFHEIKTSGKNVL